MSTAALTDAAASVEVAETPRTAARTHLKLNDVAGRRRYLASGLGALAPILASLLIVDIERVFTHMTVPVFAGWLLRVVLLFAIGSAAAWLYHEEQNPLKLFQLGVAMPAFITAMASGQNVDKVQGLATDVVPAVRQQGLLEALSPVASLYAAPPQGGVHSFAQPPREGLGAQVWRGFTGGSSRGASFVYVRQVFPAAGPAFVLRGAIEQRTGLRARVYGPDGPERGFVVVLGDWLTESDAARLLAEAKSEGIDATSWTRPAKAD